MDRALELTREGKNEPGASPLGRAMVLDGRVVAKGHNEAASHPDVMANAERLTICRAGAAHGRNQLRGVTLNYPVACLRWRALGVRSIGSCTALDGMMCTGFISRTGPCTG